MALTGRSVPMSTSKQLIHSTRSYLQLMAFPLQQTPPEDEQKDTDVVIENFIAMDPPGHDQQRATVASVAPSNLANFQPLIRERVEIFSTICRWVKRLIGLMR